MPFNSFLFRVPPSGAVVRSCWPRGELRRLRSAPAGPSNGAWLRFRRRPRRCRRGEARRRPSADTANNAALPSGAPSVSYAIASNKGPHPIRHCTPCIAPVRTENTNAFAPSSRRPHVRGCGSGKHSRPRRKTECLRPLASTGRRRSSTLPRLDSRRANSGCSRANSDPRCRLRGSLGCYLQSLVLSR